jgi:NitT/TauT family transport system ATP-binding protein
MLDLKSIGFAWPSRPDVRILADISMTIGPTERLAIAGASGIGKSTLCKLMCALLKPQTGQVLLDNAVLGAPGSAVTMVFQHYTCFDWLTVMQNVEFGLTNSGNARHVSRSEAEALLDKVGLARFAGYYPAELSGGMRQRVAIARALAVRPRVLILDEPFSAVDIIIKRSLRKLVLELQREIGFAVVVTLHSLEDIAAFATRVTCLRGKPATISADIGTSGEVVPLVVGIRPAVG